jgi:hypothetical protein
MPFATNVFVNCPFDEGYLSLLRPILFAVADLGFTPRIALESLDSGAPRVEKIIRLIGESKYAVHDLSRISAATAGEYYRLNMPFELGLDVGCRLFKGRQWREKRCLILEAEPYRYQAAISDMSNSDIAVHAGEPVKALTVVRNWLNTEARLRAPGPSHLWGRFTDFMAENYDVLKGRGYSDADIRALPVPELMDSIDTWIATH